MVATVAATLSVDRHVRRPVNVLCSGQSVVHLGVSESAVLATTLEAKPVHARATIGRERHPTAPAMSAHRPPPHPQPARATVHTVPSVPVTVAERRPFSMLATSIVCSVPLAVKRATPLRTLTLARSVSTSSPAVTLARETRS